jgi:gluconolactonase
MNERERWVRGLGVAGILAAMSPLLCRGDLPAEGEVKAELVILTGDYTEGVVVDHAGWVYFSHEKIITRMKPDGSEATTWAETGAPNGHKILANGQHLVCDASRRAVLLLDGEGKFLKNASDRSEGEALRGPNDLTLDVAHGGFYFTDPGGSDEARTIGTVNYVDAQGVTTTVARELAFPNGIALRPDGKELLVAESKRNRILAYEVQGPGKLGERRVFADLPGKSGDQIDNQPDGMCLDAAGNLYVAHYGMRQVQVLDRSGKLVRRYGGGNLTTSNVAFSGPRMDQLYVTGGTPGGVFRLDLRGVEGLKILPPRGGD